MTDRVVLDAALGSGRYWFVPSLRHVSGSEDGCFAGGACAGVYLHLVPACHLVLVFTGDEK